MRNIRLHDPRRKDAAAIRKEHATLLRGLAKLGSDVIGEKATEAAAALLRRAVVVKRGA